MSIKKISVAFFIIILILIIIMGKINELNKKINSASNGIMTDINETNYVYIDLGANKGT
jgi:hypothetical protein